MLTAVAGVITAIAGLVIALNQAGVIGGGASAPAADAIAAADEAGGGAAAPGSGDGGGGGEAPGGAPAEADTAESGFAALVAIPARVVLGEATFQILGVAARPRGTGSRTVVVRVRMLNESNYSANFWDDSFRLLVDGIPRAPVGGLNEVVRGRSAVDGAVVFVVPGDPQDLVLRIEFAGEAADIRLRPRRPEA